MALSETRSITEIPKTLIRRSVEPIWHFTVGFVRVERSAETEDAILLGSGVLVKVGKVHAILTADHVLGVLPRAGRVGLILSDKPEKTTIDITGVHYLSIARGDVPELGPDIGAVILSQHIASLLEARKSFYNLDVRKEQISSYPPDDQEGIWIAQGFVEEKTVLDSGPSRYEHVKAFCQFGAAGGVEDYVSRGEHDYYTFPLKEPPSEDIPANFGGCSGGGLWHVLIVKKKEGGELAIKQTLLQGMAYFQQPPNEGSSALRCHGSRSIYEVAYSVIGQYTI